MLLETRRTMGWKRWVGMGGLREEGGAPDIQKMVTSGYRGREGIWQILPVTWFLHSPF